MKAPTFRTWLKQLPSLSFIQRKTLLQALASPQDEPGAQTRLMIDGATVRTASQVAGIHRTTSFRWRHRLLRQPAQENDAEEG